MNDNSSFRNIVRESGRGRVIVFPSLCKGCGLCLQVCPQQTLGWSEDLGVYGTPLPRPGFRGTDCIACKTCQIVCPDCAILIERRS